MAVIRLKMSSENERVAWLRGKETYSLSVRLIISELVSDLLIKQKE
jgi:hypothetical protein